MATIISGINKIVNGGMPSILIQVPPNKRRIGRFNRSAIRYILGTITKVIKNANVNPKMMVQDNGFQNLALSPPKKMCGSSSENIRTKSMLKPMAKGMPLEGNRSISRDLMHDCAPLRISGAVRIPQLITPAHDSV